MLYVQQEGEAEKFVEELAVEVSSRLQAIGMKGRNLTLKLMVRRPDAPAETAKFMGRFVVFQLLKPPSLWGFFFCFSVVETAKFFVFQSLKVLHFQSLKLQSLWVSVLFSVAEAAKFICKCFVFSRWDCQVYG